jgi:outer membrane protein OmpA-like peptidoglycan-associated protein
MKAVVLLTMAMLVSRLAFAQVSFTGSAEFGAKDLTADDVERALGPPRTRSVAMANDRTAAQAGVSDPSRRLALQLVDAGNPDELSAAAKRQLDVVAEALKSGALAATRFVVSGHTESAGDAGASVSLSQRWADAVKAYLVVVQKIDARRLEATGRGAIDPIDPSYPDSPANRRVQITARP